MLLILEGVDVVWFLIGRFHNLGYQKEDPSPVLEVTLQVSATPEGVRAITLADFREALQKVRPSVSKDVLSEFERWNRAYGSR